MSRCAYCSRTIWRVTMWDRGKSWVDNEDAHSCSQYLPHSPFQLGTKPSEQAS